MAVEGWLESDTFFFFAGESLLVKILFLFLFLFLADVRCTFCSLHLLQVFVHTMISRLNDSSRRVEPAAFQGTRLLYSSQDFSTVSHY